jgi:Fe-S cluster assembly protein SufD
MSTGVSAVENISAAAVEAVSQAKGEPEWMLELRLRAWRFFEEIPWPSGTEETWRRTRLTGFNLDEYKPLPGAGSAVQLPQEVTGSLAEIASAGSLAYVDGSVQSQDVEPSLAARGVVFTDLDTAVRDFPELVQRFFGSVVASDENKFSALHYALWNSGTFVYIPRNVTIERPLQTVIWQNSGKFAGLHHTIVATEEGASVTLAEDFLETDGGMSDREVSWPRARRASSTTCICRTYPTRLGDTVRSECSSEGYSHELLHRLVGSRLTKAWINGAEW